MELMPLKPPNGKLDGGKGKPIWTFSLRAKETCPGSTSVCEKVCYAIAGFFSFPKNVEQMRKHHEMTKSSELVSIVLAQILLCSIRHVRIHASGDFYDADYVRKWIKIVKRAPHVIFFAYTRSWRIPEMQRALRQLANLPNMTLWLSADSEAAPTRKLAQSLGSKVSWLKTSEDDVPRWRMDLAFRTRKVRRQKPVEKKVFSRTALPMMVCPEENGATPNMNCELCGYCF